MLTDRITECQILKESEKCCVMLASMAGHENKIILKKLSPSLFFLYEYLSSVNSIYFPEIYELELQKDCLLVAEEFVRGHLLAKLLSEQLFPAQDAILLVLQLCDSVLLLHRANPPIIHRDLNPWNLMLTKEHILKIIDFDTARTYKPGAVCDTVRLGTAEYAPPEQFGFSQTDVRSDIYSIGLILYELAYGRAFQKSDTIYPAAGSIYKKLNRIISRCTMFSPSQRYQSIPALKHDLVRLLPYRLRPHRRIT